MESLPSNQERPRESRREFIKKLAVFATGTFLHLPLNTAEIQAAQEMESSGFQTIETHWVFENEAISGDITITKYINEYIDESIKKTVFIAPHPDELAAHSLLPNQVKETAESVGITVTSSLEKRNLRLQHNNHNQPIFFDPNRIYTNKGIERTLHTLNRHLPKQVAEEVTVEIQKIRDHILETVTDQNTKLVVALHTNTPGRYGVNSYRKSEMFGQALVANINKQQGNDYFFLTNSKPIYDKLADGPYAVVLEKSEDDDGSLSQFCTQAEQDYINIEALDNDDEVMSQMASYLQKQLEF